MPFDVSSVGRDSVNIFQRFSSPGGLRPCAGFPGTLFARNPTRKHHPPPFFRSQRSRAIVSLYTPPSGV